MNAVRGMLWPTMIALAACGGPVFDPPPGPPADERVEAEAPPEDPVEDPLEAPVEDPLEDPVEDPLEEPVEPEAPPPETVALSVLSYNVAGLPLGLSSSNPATNSALISPMLNDFDLVLVQEDFGYHDELASEADHPHQSEPAEASLADSLGDGLNRFSRSSFTGHERVRWEQCNGWIGAKNDCLTPKGFTFAEHEIGGGLVHVYNLHNDAGREEGDVEARLAQVEQLLAFIDARSAGVALIVAGDTNMKPEEDEDTLARLLDGADLTDTCRALDCGSPALIDRVMFRSSDEVGVEVVEWAVDERFVDAEGEALSDHDAVRVDLQVTVGLQGADPG